MAYASTVQLPLELRLDRFSPHSAKFSGDLRTQHDASHSRRTDAPTAIDTSEVISHAAAVGRSNTPNYTYGPCNDADESDVDVPQPTYPSRNRQAPGKVSRPLQGLERSHAATSTYSDHRPPVETSQGQVVASYLTRSEIKSIKDREHGKIGPKHEAHHPPEAVSSNKVIDTREDTASLSSGWSTYSYAPSPPPSPTPFSQSRLKPGAYLSSQQCVGIVGLGVVRKWQLTQQVSLSLRQQCVTTELARADSLFDVPNTDPVYSSELLENDFISSSAEKHSDYTELLSTTPGDISEQVLRVAGDATNPSASAKPADVDGSSANQGHVDFGFGGAANPADNTYQASGGNVHKPKRPGDNDQDGSGQGRTPQKRSRPEDQVFFRCVFYGTGHEQEDLSCATQHRHVSQLRRHHEKHNFYYCCNCGQQFLSEQQRDAHGECFKICQREGCPRIGDFLKDPPHGVYACAHKNTQRDCWRTLFRLAQGAFGLRHASGLIPEPGPYEPNANSLRTHSSHTSRQGQHVHAPNTAGNAAAEPNQQFNRSALPAQHSDIGMTNALLEFAALARESMASAQAMAEQGILPDDALRLALDFGVISLTRFRQQVQRLSNGRAVQQAATHPVQIGHSTPDTSTSSGQAAHIPPDLSSFPSYPVNRDETTNMWHQEAPTSVMTSHTGAIFPQQNAFPGYNAFRP